MTRISPSPEPKPMVRMCLLVHYPRNGLCHLQFFAGQRVPWIYLSTTICPLVRHNQPWCEKSCHGLTSPLRCARSLVKENFNWTKPFERVAFYIAPSPRCSGREMPAFFRFFFLVGALKKSSTMGPSLFGVQIDSNNRNITNLPRWAHRGSLHSIFSSDRKILSSTEYFFPLGVPPTYN
jgi:hypothetical protein